MLDLKDLQVHKGPQGPGGINGSVGSQGPTGAQGPAQAALQLESDFYSWDSGSTEQNVVSGAATEVRFDNRIYGSSSITGVTNGNNEYIEWSLGGTAMYYIEYNLGVDEAGPNTTFNAEIEYQLDGTGSWTAISGSKVD